MKITVLPSILLLLCCLSGCATPGKDSQEFKQTWAATRKVLQQHGLLVRESRYREHTLVAVSRVNGDFLNKARVKVVARVEVNEEGYYDPMIRVINQWDNSDVSTHGHPDYQAGHRWINHSHNATMEAQLYNEIQAELGKANPYSGKAWKPIGRTRREPSIIPSATSPAPSSETRLQEMD